MKKVIRFMISAQLIKIKCEQIKAMKVLKRKIEERGAPRYLEFNFPELEKYECNFSDFDLETIFPKSSDNK